MAESFSYGNSWLERYRDAKARIRNYIGATRLGYLRLFIFTFLISFVVGAFFATRITPKFVATVVLTAQKQTNDSQSAGGNALSSLAGMSNLFDPKQSENLIAFQQILTTSDLAEVLLRNREFVQICYPLNYIHHSFVGRLIKGMLGQPTTSQIGRADIQTFLQKNFFLQKLDAPEYFELSYSDKNRNASIHALSIVLTTADTILRQRERTSLNSQITYLSQALKTNADVEQQALFRRLLLDKLSSKVLLDTQPTFAFRVFDSPYAPLVQTSPNVAMLLAILFIFSVTVATAVTLFYGWLSSRREVPVL